MAQHPRSRSFPFPPCTNKVKNRHVYLLCQMSKNSLWNRTCDAVIRCEHFVSKAAQTLSRAAPVSTDRRAEFQLSRLARDHNISRCTTAQSLYFTLLLTRNAGKCKNACQAALPTVHRLCERCTIQTLLSTGTYNSYTGTDIKKLIQVKCMGWHVNTTDGSPCETEV